jgi:hypothetical protein
VLQASTFKLHFETFCGVNIPKKGFGGCWVGKEIREGAGVAFELMLQNVVLILIMGTI